MNQNNPYLPYQAQYPNMRQQNNGIIWVQGIEGAKAFQLPPNANAMLLDSENDGIFYIKTSDNVGMCNMRIFRYEEITHATPTPGNIDLSEYVKKDELQELIKDIVKEKTDEQTVSANANARAKAKPLIEF